MSENLSREHTDDQLYTDNIELRAECNRLQSEVEAWCATTNGVRAENERLKDYVEDTRRTFGSSTFGKDLINENERLTQERDRLAKCSYMGPLRDCPTHGESEQLKKLQQQLAALRAEREDFESKYKAIALCGHDHSTQYWELKCNSLQAECERLRREVHEWLCSTCNTVYPGPPQDGVACVVCPKCGGDCGPRLSMNVRDLAAENERLKQELVAVHLHLDAQKESVLNCAKKVADLTAQLAAMTALKDEVMATRDEVWDELASIKKDSPRC